MDLHGKPELVHYNGTYDASSGIQDLTGIEYFTYLISLDCSMNYLVNIDLSSNTALEALDCSYTSLDRLDLSNNTALKVLICGNAGYGCYDLEHYIFADHTKGSEIWDWDRDIMKAVCPLNHFTSIDLSANTALEVLNCMNCGLMELDLHNNTVLKYVQCLNEDDRKIFSIYTLLRSYIEYNEPIYDEEYSEPDGDSLVYVYSYIQDDGTAVVYRYTEESFIGRYLNRLESLNFMGNTALEVLDCSSCDVISLDVSEMLCFGAA